MASANADIVDSHLGFVTSTQLELSLLVGNSQQMDVSRGVFVQRHRLKQDVVVSSLRCDFVGQINNLVDSLLDLESIWVHLLTNFALESLPVEGSDVLLALVHLLLLLLGEDP